MAILVTALAVLGGCTSKPSTPRTTGDFSPERVLDQGGSVASLSWSPDGRLLAATVSDGGLRVWNTTTYRLQLNRSVAAASIGLPAWSPDGGCIALADIGAQPSVTVRIINSSTGAPVAEIGKGTASSLGEGVRSLSWSPDGGWLAVGLSTGRVLVLDAAAWTTEKVLGDSRGAGSGQEATAVAWSPEGRWLASLVRDCLRIWDPADWSLIRNLSACSAGQMTWSSDGSSIGLVNSSAVGMVSTSNWTVFLSIPFPTSSRGPAALSPANLGLAAYPGVKVSGYKGTPVEVLNLTTRYVENRLLADNSPGFSCYMAPAWSPDGRRLATAYTNGKVVLWSHDADRDMYADLVDRFPDDRTQWNDTDRDGYGDNPGGLNPDAFPNDPSEWMDTDKDGMGDNSDPLPTVHNTLFAAIVAISLAVAAVVVIYVQRRQKRAIGAALQKQEGASMIQPYQYAPGCPRCGGPMAPYPTRHAPMLVCPGCGAMMRPPR